jgi:hypothetical protein
MLESTPPKRRRTSIFDLFNDEVESVSAPLSGQHLKLAKRARLSIEGSGANSGANGGDMDKENEELVRNEDREEDDDDEITLPHYPLHL